MADQPLRLGVVYDFRNPPDSGIATPALYAEIIDQVTWLDGLGLDLVWFTEHHFVDDGYLPSWTPMAGAMAARTRRVRFSSDICLLPFIAQHGITDLVTWAVPPGLRPEQMNASLERFARDVAPRLRAAASRAAVVPGTGA